MPCKPNVSYCCTLFKEAIKSKGRGGLAIIPTRSHLFGLYFSLEFRAVDEENINAQMDTGVAKFYLCVRQAIKFCPWCGKNLTTFYSKQQEGLVVYEEESWISEV